MKSLGFLYKNKYISENYLLEKKYNKDMFLYKNYHLNLYQLCDFYYLSNIKKVYNEKRKNVMLTYHNQYSNIERSFLFNLNKYIVENIKFKFFYNYIKNMDNFIEYSNNFDNNKKCIKKFKQFFLILLEIL